MAPTWPVYQTGLEQDDEVRQVDGQTIGTAGDVETALREGKIGYEESGRLLRFYEDGLNGYTYLEQ